MIASARTRRFLALANEAVVELSRRKLRSLLTLLGLIFGVASVVAMQGVGEGSRREALRLVESLGLRNLIVDRVVGSGEQIKETRARSLGLTRADARAALEVIPGAVAFAAEKRVAAFSVFSDEGGGDMQVSGVGADYFALASLRLDSGRGLTVGDEDTAAPVVVLGYQAARQLFPRGNALDQFVKVNHVWLQVVGVLADRDLGADRFEGVSLNVESNRLFIPLSCALRRFRFAALDDEIDRFVLQLADVEHLSADARLLTRVLNLRHADVADYTVLVPQQLYEQHQKTQKIFAVVMGSIAGVSLLVGGIGIMNIMLANVLERRREIGLLRALGARRSDIVAAFMSEAVILCAVGALAGLLAGFALAYIIAAFAAWKVAWSMSFVAISTLLCALTGVAFGVYPALQAADLDPIAAIRAE
ncbi:MAG: ABC transporter permease [Rudaea sp.]|uniref:ABC transporter permease n=1 Tax=Rudaea sp. 3F27F6 TaxID=2502208 RepID=UPI0010F80483|nr:ABC transporter permease [Rudaea sp. 3F27F6]MBR0346002.1 ABC transporter permease [Rudaea sp.]